jgi:hypothetical protein
MIRPVDSHGQMASVLGQRGQSHLPMSMVGADDHVQLQVPPTGRHTAYRI